MTTLVGPAYSAAQWEAALTGAGSSVTLDTAKTPDALRYTTGTGTYGAGKIARRLVATTSDCLIRTEVEIGAGAEQYPTLHIRSTNDLDTTGYFINLRDAENKVILDRVVSYAATNVAELVLTIDPAAGQRFGIVASAITSGTSLVIKVKAWATTGTEPTTGGPDGDGYQIKYTDTAPLTGNRVGLSLRAGVSSAWSEWNAEKLYVTTGEDPAAPAAAAVAGTFDTTAEGWTAGSGAPEVRHSGTNSRTGAGNLKITALAAGSSEARGVLETVAPGDTVGVSCYLRPEVNARDTQVYVNWYTSADAYISSSQGAESVYATGMALNTYAYQAFNAIAPPTAAKARVHVTILAAAIGDVLRLDDVITTIATEGTAAPTPAIGSGFWHAPAGTFEPLDLYVGSF